ncbi:MAG: 4Fe-4S binding protein [Deltaproteobacteria bacterium]|nr:4Fe-4S binding protein [Deltaproteobacteria bacterium]
MTFAKARRLVTLSLLGLIIGGALTGIGLGTFCHFHLGLVRLVCPVGYLELCLANRAVYWDLFIPFLMVIGFVTLIGRVFCSWACPVPLATDILSRSLDKIFSYRPSKWRKRVDSILPERSPNLSCKDGFAILIGCGVAVLIFRYPFVSTFCPIGVITRNVILITRLHEINGDLFFLSIPIVAGYLLSAGWRGYCPVGMLQALATWHSRILSPAVDLSKCNHCATCKSICPAHFELNKGIYKARICIKCFECIDHCPRDAIYLSLSITKIKQGRKSQKHK